MEFLLWILILVIVWVITYFWKNETNEQEYRQRQYFFSYSELQFFYILQNVLSKNFWNKYGIFPKVRLADIFEPYKKSQSLLNKIWSKHIDFLIVDLENHCNPILWIELNWTSHQKKSVLRNDYFKQEIFKKTGLQLAYFNNNDIKSPAFIEWVLTTKYLWNINKSLIWSEWEKKN